MSTRKTLVVVGSVMALLVAFATREIVRRRRPPTSVSTPSSANSSANVVSSAPRRTAALDVAETVYDGKLGSGWADWGWGPHHLSTGGPARVVFGGYGGIVFRHAPLDAAFGALSFRYKASEDWPEFLNVSFKSATVGPDRLPLVAVETRHVAALPGGWREVLIDLSELNPDRLAFDRVVIGARSAVGFDWVEIDKVVLVKPSAAGSSTSFSRDVALSIECRAPSHPISPMIYGGAGGAWESGQTSQRVGGNPTSRFNWDLNVWNAAADWFYENNAGVDLAEVLEAGLKHGSSTALTVPTIGWVAKDSVSVGFPRSRFARQRKFDQYKPEAGDGYRPDGVPIQPGPPTQTSVAAPPELIGRWVHKLRERDRARGARSVQMYILDNEPSLWNDTHRDVHPLPLTYDELLERTLGYASAIRKADPEAIIAGPAEWGWMGYMYSAKDRVAGKEARPDRLAHGDVPLIPWYLQQITQHEKSSGDRVLDVLDVHFYPAAEGIYKNARTDAEAAALRLRSTRALWDPSYPDESWIKEPIRLIPRLKEWVTKYHPGLRISLGEWSFGADQDMSGGLATAEALGRFGQQGLDAAFYWDGPKANTATFWAFRAFRNFDGRGARFQDASLTTKEGANVSLFASRNAEGTKLVAVLLNLDPKSTASVRLDLNGCSPAKSHRVFRFVSGSNGLLSQQPGKRDGQRISESLPPYSLTVIDLETEGDSTH